MTKPVVQLQLNPTGLRQALAECQAQRDELLAALETLTRAIERSPNPTPFDGLASEARAAIAKAKAS
jgi:hypothetical protein